MAAAAKPWRACWLFRVKSTTKFKIEQHQFTRGAPLIFTRAPKYNYLFIFAQNSRMFIEPVSTKMALWTILSRMASAWTPPPSLTNQFSFLYWVQKIVEASSCRRSISSKRKWCSSLMQCVLHHLRCEYWHDGRNRFVFVTCHFQLALEGASDWFLS